MKDLDEIILEIPSNDNTATTTASVIIIVSIVYRVLVTCQVHALIYLILRPRQRQPHTLEAPSTCHFLPRAARIVSHTKLCCLGSQNSQSQWPNCAPRTCVGLSPGLPSPGQLAVGTG